MEIRKILIIVTSSIILLMLILVSYISYEMGINYGEENAEEIRVSKAYETSIHKK